MKKKLIICCALTGSLPTKEQNPNVPITPDEIAGKSGIFSALGKEQMKQRAEYPGQHSRHTGAVHKFTDACPQADGPCHGNGQGHTRLGTLQRGCGQAASGTCKQTAKDTDCQHTCPNPAHDHR